MSHQNFQEAIAELSTNGGLNPAEMKNQFNLNEDDMMAMKSYNPLIQAVTPRPVLPCCCCV